MEKSGTLRKMLVVDDEPGMRQLLEGIFKDRGFTVTSVSNGEKAIQILDEQRFDVVITDLKMPGKDGMAVLRAARTVSAETPVILVTAYATIDTAVDAMRLGARDFIQKPFSMAEI